MDTDGGGWTVFQCLHKNITQDERPLQNKGKHYRQSVIKYAGKARDKDQFKYICNNQVVYQRRIIWPLYAMYVGCQHE